MYHLSYAISSKDVAIPCKSGNTLPGSRIGSPMERQYIHCCAGRILPSLAPNGPAALTGQHRATERVLSSALGLGPTP